MASEASRPPTHDPATRGFDGRGLSPVSPPAEGEPPSPAWLAQLGRAAFADGVGREVMKRMTEDGLAVPGDDPLYQHLGALRLFSEVLRTQHEEQLARFRAVEDQALAGLAKVLAAADAAAAARRAEDEAAAKRAAAEFESVVAGATRQLREALAEERNATTSAMTLSLAEAVNRLNGQKSPREARGGLSLLRVGPGPAAGAQARRAAVWAAVVALSMLTGLLLLWVVRR